MRLFLFESSGKAIQLYVIHQREVMVDSAIHEAVCERNDNSCHISVGWSD